MRERNLQLTFSNQAIHNRIDGNIIQILTKCIYGYAYTRIGFIYTEMYTKDKTLDSHMTLFASYPMILSKTSTDNIKK